MEITVFQKMTKSTADLINVVNEEVGTKCCQAFANRAFEALNHLNFKNENDARRASNIFLDNLQTLFQGGVTSEDYDKIDFIERGNTITVSARVQALLRAFRRKGFMVIDTTIAVPNGDDVYFEEHYENGQIVYILKDNRRNIDREITAERLVNGYFNRFICRLEIRDLNRNMTIFTNTEMSNSEILSAQNASDNGIFQSEWVILKDKNGNVVYKDSAKTQPKKVKIIYDGKQGRELKLNLDSMWGKWTSEMVRKTIMRRAFKNLKETLPEMSKTILAFDTDYPPITEDDVPSQPKEIDVVGYTINNVNLSNLTEEQKHDVDDVFEIYKMNPENARLDAEKIKGIYETGKAIPEIINEFYAEIVNISKSKKLYHMIENIIKGVPYEESKG